MDLDFKRTRKQTNLRLDLIQKQKSLPLISIIIPTYNRWPLLQRCLQAVAMQVYPQFEVMIMDDGSSDETAANIEKFLDELCLQSQWRREQFKYFHLVHGGVSWARNQGVIHSHGEWLAFCDSDDVWLPTKLWQQVQYAATNPQYRLIHTDEIWMRKGVRVNQMKKHQRSGGDIFLQALHSCVIGPSSVMIHRDLWSEVGGFREDFPVCEDYDLWLRITHLHEVGYLAEALLLKYGGHEDQLSTQYPVMDLYRIRTLFDLWRKWRPLADGVRDLKKERLVEVLLKKSQIVLQGRQKGQSLEVYEKIQQISDEVGLSLNRQLSGNE